MSNVDISVGGGYTCHWWIYMSLVRYVLLVMLSNFMVSCVTMSRYITCAQYVPNLIILTCSGPINFHLIQGKVVFTAEIHIAQFSFFLILGEFLYESAI